MSGYVLNRMTGTLHRAGRACAGNIKDGQLRFTKGTHPERLQGVKRKCAKCMKEKA